MSAAWLTPPVQLHSSRMFDCEGFTEQQCQYYRYPWRFWYEADHVYALPTIAFFMCIIGMFIIGNIITKVLGYSNKFHSPLAWRRVLAASRYLAYRGFYVERLNWNSAPVGLLILGMIGAVFFFCMDLIPGPYYWESLDWGGSPPLATRSGWMALACMPFVFATASKTNWITLVTGVTHEKIQVFHRWIGYAFFILALLHTFPFIVYHVRLHDMVMQFEMGLIFYWTGIVAIILQAWLTFASFGPVRALGYEFFRAAHFFVVILFVLILFWHCDYTLTSWDYFIATAAVYVPCLVYPWLRTVFEYGLGQRARISVEENGFTQISVPAKFDWVPGQHCFLRFRGFGLDALSSHPFTICSLPSLSAEESQSIFYIRHQGGFTAKLYHYAMQNSGGTIPVLVDGPYGGIDPEKFHGSDRIAVIAGGSGAGWILPFIERYARRHHYSKTAPPLSQDTSPAETSQTLDSGGSARNRPRSLRVILATRDTSTRVWFNKAIANLLAQYGGAEAQPNLSIEVFLTGEADSTRELRSGVQATEGSTTQSSSSSVLDEEKIIQARLATHDTTNPTSSAAQELSGRPDLPEIIRSEARQIVDSGICESLAVFACGPLTMQNDIRNAVARENSRILKDSRIASRVGGVYLHLEHFSWA